MLTAERALSWWIERHGGDLALTAAVSGCTVRQVQRWVRAGRVPATVAALVDQLHGGAFVSVGASILLRSDCHGSAVETAANQAAAKRFAAADRRLEREASVYRRAKVVNRRACAEARPRHHGKHLWR